MLIALDAGHGGSDPGAVYNGRNEKDDNLRLALAVGDILKIRASMWYIREQMIYMRLRSKKPRMPMMQERIILCHFTEIPERIPIPLPAHRL